jgi:hypothetical protein
MSAERIEGAINIVRSKIQKSEKLILVSTH